MSWIKDLLGLNVARPLPIGDLQFDRASLLDSASRSSPRPDAQAANAVNTTTRAIDARAAVRADLSTIAGSLHDGASSHILPATPHGGASPVLPTIQPATPHGGASLDFGLPTQSGLDLSLFGSHGDVGGQIVFVDSSVRDLQTLLAGIKPGMDVVLLDSQHDALDQIAETLAGHHGITAVHIIADGRTGEIDFSSGAFSLGNLTTGSHAADLAAIDNAMAPNGDLMVWSCNTGQGAAGQAFIDALSQLTGADVAASTGLTGAGGNWVLEAHTGPIHATAPVTNEGIQHLDADGMDLAALSIIFQSYTPNTSGSPSYSLYYTGNRELGLSDGAPGGTTTIDDLFPGHGPVGRGGCYSYNDSNPTDFIVFGDKAAFVATSAADGRELWITDGTTGGTYEIANINPGAGNAFFGETFPVGMGVVGSELFFAANDGSHGIELWKTDGVAGNAVLVKDINTGAGDSNPYDMVSFNGNLYFVATDGTQGGSGGYISSVKQLWKSDGTTGGTTEVYSVHANGNAFPTGVSQLTVSGSHLFFVGGDGTGGGGAISATEQQIYVSDGTSAGTHLLDPSVVAHNGIHSLANVNGTLYFDINDGTHSSQLWTSDGTAAGTQMVTDIDPSTDGLGAFDFVRTTNGEVFFVGQDDAHGAEIWETDGTGAGTKLVDDINPGSSGSMFTSVHMAVIGNEVYFVAEDSPGDGEQLWETNGTTTQKVDPSGIAVTNPSSLQNVNGQLYFAGGEAGHGESLFKFDGTHIELVSGGYDQTNTADSDSGSSVGNFVFLGGGVVVTGEPDTFTTDELTAVTGQNLFSDNGSGPDTDTGGSLSIAEVDDSAGNVGSQFALADGSLLTVHSDGTFTWDPNGKFDDLPAAGSGADPTALPNTETFTYLLTGASSDTTVTINVTGVDNNDTVIGTNGVDTLNPGTGNDIVQALGGSDAINMGANLTAADQIDGGTGNDTVNLNGNYAGGNAVTFNATTMVNVENIVLSVGHSYNLTTNDATVAATQILTVDGSALGSGDSFTFDGSAETDGSFVLIGGAGADTLTGGAGNDVFKMQSGGADTVNGGGGTDDFHFGNTLTAADAVNGGSGADKIVLDGDYTAGNALVLGAATMSSVEEIIVTAGFSYSITTNDANVAAGQSLVVNATSLGAGDVLTFNGSAETDGTFTINAGAGNDVLTGGAGNDTFNLTEGGNDTAHGGAGNDVFILNGSLTAADAINGGPGDDTVRLSGDYSGGLTFGSSTITGVERITLGAGHSYNLTTNSATVATGVTLKVYGANLGAGDDLTFNGSPETNGHFNISGGAGNDHLIGGALHDTISAGDGTNTIKGGGGGDSLTGGSGVDTFVYSAVSDSTGANYDTVHGFDASADFFDTTITVAAIDTMVAAGRLSTANFDTNLAAAVGAVQLGSHDAVLFTPTLGNLAGHTFLVVDINGTAGYQAGQDLVIDVTGMAGTLTTANFI